SGVPAACRAFKQHTASPFLTPRCLTWRGFEMNKLLLGGIAVAAILSAAPAVAQPTPAPAPVPAPQVQIHMEHKAMRAQTRDQVVAHVRETFARLDANHDGYLTKAETDAGHPA